MTRLAAVLLWMVLVVCSPAFAIQSSSSSGQPTTVLLDFGFGGQVRAGEWAPVRVVVSPMDEAVQAIARIRVETPDGGRITSMAPVATTPGKETVVPTTLWIPPSMSAVYVDLVEQGGRQIAATSYGAFAGAQAIPLPTLSTAPLIVGVDTSSLRMAFGSTTYQREFFGPTGVALREMTATARVASAIPATIGGPPWLPSTSTAYNGVTAVVLDGQTAGRLDPDGLRGLREWVVSGGRLMVVNADNTSLQQVLGEHVPAGLRILPGGEADLPVAMGGPGTIVSRSVDRASLPVGWAALTNGPELGAHGPVGLGWVMVLGFDPDQLADQKLVAATETAWHGSLVEMIRDELTAGQQRLAGRGWQEMPLRQMATERGMAWISRSPSVGVGAFTAIFAMMVALAVALGPIDRLVLKRLHALHRWWLAALAWIALASVGAWVAPKSVRSGPTTVSSIRVIDGWRPADGAAHAWQHTLDGVFLNRSVQIGLDDIDEGSWLSPLLHSWMPGGVGTLAMVPQGATMRPQPTSARLWTTRTFEQEGTTTAPVGARFEVENERLTLRLGGPMADAVELAAVHTGGRWLHLLPGGTPRREGDTTVLRATRGDLTLQPPKAFDATAWGDDSEYYGYYGYEQVQYEPEPGLVMNIGRCERRAKALHALGGTTAWAVVYLSWKDQRPLVGSDVGEEFETRWICRLAVPVVRVGEAGGTP
ncbi:MAG: hypothetical protein ACIAQU_06330 [Phycisphaerales bacterium JB064]